MDFREEVERALESGIEPLAMLSDKIYSCKTMRTSAYRTTMNINSTLLGVLTPEQYDVTADMSERSILLAKRAIAYSVRAVERYTEKKIRFDFISTRCPIAMLTKANLPEILSEAFGGDRDKGQKLCVEFPSNVVYENAEEIAPILNNIKDTGAKTILTGFGSEFCPVMRLNTLPFDYVELPKSATAQIKDEKLAKSLESVISFARDLRVEVIATGVTTDEEAEFFAHLDCYGFRKEEKAEPLFSRS